MERGNFAMRPRERRETSEQDLFRSRLDQIIDMNHALVKLGRAIDWGFLEQDVWGGLHRQAGPAAVADAADGGAGDPQAQLLGHPAAPPSSVTKARRITRSP